MKQKQNEIRRVYDNVAPFYDFLDIIPERLFYSSWREELWSKVEGGRILEIGVGTGKNIPFYPPGAQVTAIDISSNMLERAAVRAAARQDASIELLIMDVNELSFDDRIYDAVVGSFVLTVLTDPIRALREIKRVIKPDGRLLLLEFACSDNKQLALFQNLLAPLAYAIYQAHINRDVTTLLPQSGYNIVSAKAIGKGIIKIYEATPRDE